MPDYPLVLVVDDDPFNIDVISMMLEEKKVQSVCTQTGKEAVEIVMQRIELFKQGKAPMFKIILIDYSMPEMDGPTAVKKIKELFERSAIIIS